MLAIIVPFYKLKFFKETLQSLSNQTDKRFKVYIGDDASPEDCSSLLEQFKGHFDFSYNRFDTNLGGISLTKEWERCIDLSAEEEWLMILGDDDILGENVVEEFYRQFTSFDGKTNLLRYATVILNNLENEISSVFEHPKWEKSSDFYFRRFKKLTRSSLSEYIFSRSTYIRNKFKEYPLAWHSDDMAWLNFPEDKPIYSINDAIVQIRISDCGISGNVWDTKIKNQASILFYNDIVTRELSSFEKSQRLELLLGYEISLKKVRKISTYEWYFLFVNYLRNFEFISFVKLLRRILIGLYERSNRINNNSRV